MANIDKNPRQITRLRVEDQKNLERFINTSTYDSSTNTFEIGSNLEVNGNTIFKGNLDSYNDSLLTFYQGNNEQSADMAISPLFNENILSFNYYDGQAINSTINLDVSVDANILTNKSVFRHQLTLNSKTNTYIGIIYLLDNTPITSTQLLTTYTKATNGYLFLAVKVTGPVESQCAIGIGYNNNQWATIVGDAITGVTDTVKPL